MYRDNGYSGRASRIGVVVSCDAELSGQDRESLSHMMPVTITYPGTGAVDGVRGDHLLLGPPLSITPEEVGEMLDMLDQALETA